jgi:tetratricopeptide (TPR) repeat protein
MSRHLVYPSLQTDTVVLPPPPGDLEADNLRTQQLNRELGWRAGEAYDAWILGEVYAARGDYGRGLGLIREALEIARQIDHRQWLAAATMLLGCAHKDLLDLKAAQAHLTTAVDLAREIESWHWIRTASGYLALTHIARGEPDRAEQVLSSVLTPETRAQTLGQRQAWAARVELALARREPQTALVLLDRLMQAAYNLAPGVVIPQLWALRARACIQLDRDAEAESLLRAAAHTASEQAILPRLWRIHGSLAGLYQHLGRNDEADRQAAAALRVVDTIGRTIDDKRLQAHFLQTARAMIANPNEPVTVSTNRNDLVSNP